MRSAPLASSAWLIHRLCSFLVCASRDLAAPVAAAKRRLLHLLMDFSIWSGGFFVVLVIGGAWGRWPEGLSGGGDHSLLNVFGGDLILGRPIERLF